MSEGFQLPNGIVLPEPPPPLANYIPCVEQGGFVDVSGQIHLIEGELILGRVGAEIGLEEAQGMARTATANALAIVVNQRGSLGGLSMHRLRVYVVGIEGFSEQHVVGNGASDLLLEVLGDKGLHSRTSIGVAGLPFGAAVEVELTFCVDE